jgi:hypothetical protein
MKQIPPNGSRRQILQQTIEQLRELRNAEFARDPRSKTGIAAGQFLIFLRQVESGIVPPRKGLWQFLRLVARADSYREAA